MRKAATPPVTVPDRFAEYLSQGLNVSVAAERLGKSEAYGRALLYRMRRGLGPQAV